MPEKAVVILSGGQDSTTCLYEALDDGFDVYAITFDYGQRHAREIEAARTIALRAGVQHEVLELPHNVLLGTSPLVSGEPLEQYENHQSLPGGLEKTFVPLRNQLFLTLAANRAYVIGANWMYIGVSEEDYGGYPDCRAGFIDLLSAAMNEGAFTDETDTRPPLEIRTPLIGLTKSESVRYALSLPGCYEALAYSHTSYDGAYPPTGKDHATLLRAKGFEEALVPDPLILRASLEGVMALPDTPNYDLSVSDEIVTCFHRIQDLFGGDYTL